MKMQDQKSLTLRWCWFSRLGREGIAICFVNKGSQLYLYNCTQPITDPISQDAKPKIVDMLLMLIFMMRYTAYYYSVCLWRQQILWLGITTTKSILNDVTYKTENCWPSVNTHFAPCLFALCNQMIWHSISFALFWQPLYCFHWYSAWSLHCFLKIHIHISFKIYFTVSANCR